MVVFGVLSSSAEVAAGDPVCYIKCMKVVFVFFFCFTARAVMGGGCGVGHRLASRRKKPARTCHSLLVRPFAPVCFDTGALSLQEPGRSSQQSAKQGEQAAAEGPIRRLKRRDVVLRIPHARPECSLRRPHAHPRVTSSPLLERAVVMMLQPRPRRLRFRHPALGRGRLLRRCRGGRRDVDDHAAEIARAALRSAPRTIICPFSQPLPLHSPKRALLCLQQQCRWRGSTRARAAAARGAA